MFLERFELQGLACQKYELCNNIVLFIYLRLICYYTDIIKNKCIM